MPWVPNALTLLRILLIPLFCWLIFRASGPPVGWALLVFAVAALTDWLDGYLARKWKVISDFGKIADPLADKLLVLAALAALTWLPPFRLWLPIFIVIAARELGVTLLREIYKRRGFILPADRLGKVKTVMQMTGIVLAFAAWAWLPKVSPGLVLSANLWFALVAVLTVYSGLQYLKRQPRS
ncbi:MAG TPA: CDP-diacylglycerol--glycerol-3-phosphate 3-phosphatidyltransferase [Candidatus Syntrophosphaera sp.]|nr:CDP-diacylglycerol--glycerol-3-phosphate 3-phosphatidyltransferase [Candidatus Syntrophosphaera sp.]